MPTLSLEQPKVVTNNYSAWILTFSGTGSDVTPGTENLRSGTIALAGFRAAYLGASENIAPRVEGAASELNRLDFQMKVMFGLWTPGNEGDDDYFRYAGDNLNPNYSAALPYKMSQIPHPTTASNNPVEILNNVFVPPNMGGLGNAGYIGGGACPPYIFIDLSNSMIPPKPDGTADTGYVYIWAVK